MRISHYTKKCTVLLTKLGHYLVMLSIKWLQLHDVGTKWASNMAIFNSPYYKKNYLPEDRTAIILGMVDVPNLFDNYKAKPVETIMEIIKELDKLMKPLKSPRYKKPSQTHRVQRLKAKQKKMSK